MVPTRKAGNEKDVGNIRYLWKQREYKNLQGEGGTGWHQSEISGDLSSEALHQLIQDGMHQESLEMEGEQGCVAKSHGADPKHLSPPTPGGC